MTIGRFRDGRRACSCCGIRWPQDRTGLCRRCKRAVGIVDAEQSRSERQRPVFRVPEPEARPLRTALIDGVEYEVMFDGT